MLLALDALMLVAEVLLGMVFGAFAWAMLHVTAESWLKRDPWDMRLVAALLTCALAALAAVVWMDGYRHLSYVLIALIGGA